MIFRLNVYTFVQIERVLATLSLGCKFKEDDFSSKYSKTFSPAILIYFQEKSCIYESLVGYELWVTNEWLFSVLWYYFIRRIA